jgi:hypothetical protein
MWKGFVVKSGDHYTPPYKLWGCRGDALHSWTACSAWNMLREQMYCFVEHNIFHFYVLFAEHEIVGVYVLLQVIRFKPRWMQL